MAMVETIANFTQIKMEKFAGHSTVRSQPVFRIGPEAFDAINMVTSLGTTLLLTDDHMAANQAQGGVGLPLVRVVERTRECMLLDLPHDLCTTMCSNGGRLHRTVALNETEDQHFAGGSPPAFPLAMPAKGGFVAFDGSGKGFTQLLFVSAAGADQTIKSFFGRAADIVTKPLATNRDAKSKTFNKATFGRVRKTTGIPDAGPTVTVTTGPAFEPTVREFVSLLSLTSSTLFHGQTSLTLVRFG